jgi:hypothetical protein
VNEAVVAPVAREHIENMPAGREMDALVAKAYGLSLEPPCPTRHITDDAQYDSDLGWGGWCYTCGKSIDEVGPEAAPYSTSIARAWALKERCYANIPRGSAKWLTFVRALPAYSFHMGAADICVAICRAALLASLEDSVYGH